MRPLAPHGGATQQRRVWNEHDDGEANSCKHPL